MNNKKIIFIIIGLILFSAITGGVYWFLNEQEMILQNGNSPLSVFNPFGILGGGCGPDGVDCKTSEQIASRINIIKELGAGFVLLEFGYIDADWTLKEPLHSQGFSLMNVIRALFRNGPEDYFNEHPELQGKCRYPEAGQILFGTDVCPEDLTPYDYVWSYKNTQEQAEENKDSQGAPFYNYISFSQEPDGYIDPETYEVLWTTITSIPPDQQETYRPYVRNTAEDFALNLRLFYKAYKSVNPNVFIGIGETGMPGAMAYRFKGDCIDIPSWFGKGIESCKRYDGFHIRAIKELQRLERIEKDPKLIIGYLKEHPDITQEEAQLIFSPDNFERYFDAAGLDIGQGPAWREPLFTFDKYVETNAPKEIRHRVKKAKKSLENLGYPNMLLVNDEGEHPSYKEQEEKESYARIIVKKYVVGLAHGMNLIFQDNPYTDVGILQASRDFIYHIYRHMTQKLQGLKPGQITALKEDENGNFVYRFETDEASGFIIWKHPQFQVQQVQELQPQEEGKQQLLILERQENTITLKVSEGVGEVLVSHSLPAGLVTGDTAKFEEYVIPVSNGEVTIANVGLEPLYITEVK